MKLILFYFYLQIRLLFSLQCWKSSQIDCVWNSTCRIETEECHRNEQKSRGGIFCSALIQIDSNEFIHLKHFGCMFDQEATKTCFNQSKCQFKYTNKDQQYLHCCCDQNQCNDKFDLSNPTIETIREDFPSVVQTKCSTTIDPEGKCREKRFSKMNLYKMIVFLVCFSTLIVISLILIRKLSTSEKKKKFCENIFRKCRKEKVSSSNDEQKSMLNEIIEFNDEEKRLDNPFDLNRFQIEPNPIKKGRFSEIYRSKYENKDFILKVLKETSTNEQKSQLFHHEKQIYSLPHFQHENLLKYFGSFESNSNSTLIFELAPFGSLRDYLRENFINDDKQLIHCCSQIANGLEYLHRDYSQEISSRRYPIAHRDLKSDNILIFSSQRWVLSDFAMSIHLDEKQLSSTDQQQQMGTPRYMSPEILAGTIGNELNSLLKSDVYSLSLVFWEILSRSKHLEANEFYVLPYDEQLKERGIDGNPSINQMLEIVLGDSTSNRPFIRSSWRKSTLINEKLIRTIEQCWDSTPEGRISSSLVAHRLKFSSN